jgi:RNA polymerase sigma-70 factor, ECF subfamily
MDAAGALAEVLKGEGPRVLATLARTIGDLAVAEDALSEATITALDRWPRTGIPADPRAWLAVVARRKALDLLRRESARAAKETAAFRWGTGAAPDQIGEAIEAMEPATSLRDDMLRLIFTCCHPALSREAQVALSLRTLARLEVPAIARAFLVPEATMAKRLVRARAKIAAARIPYAIPADTELPGRLAAVLAVVYLIATEAHAPTGGDAVARGCLAGVLATWLGRRRVAMDRGPGRARPAGTTSPAAHQRTICADDRTFAETLSRNPSCPDRPRKPDVPRK